ncbi:MAG: alkene reductase [Nitrospinota bacterium]
MNEKKDLLAPISIGPFSARNRVVMAPMTRNRADRENIPTKLMAEYYAQRAEAGLIITEATQVSSQGTGYPFTPGIYRDTHVEGWKKVTQAVHEKGGRIFLQLWHTGRISHSSYHAGNLPVAPSAICARGEAATYEGMKPLETPRALETEEISGVVKQFKNGAQKAKEAGFDGVEIHGANGYLIDQFLRDGTNKRTDHYGGSQENRCRFLLEVSEAVCEVWGKGRVAVRLSPSGTFNDMTDSDPEKTFGFVAEQLSRYDLAYLHIVDALDGDIRHGAKVVSLDILRKRFNGTLMVNGGYTKERGNRAILNGEADLVSFGQLFLANPDLVTRFQKNTELNLPDMSTFYGGNEKGYTDYPFLEA